MLQPHVSTVKPKRFGRCVLIASPSPPTSGRCSSAELRCALCQPIWQPITTFSTENHRRSSVYSGFAHVHSAEGDASATCEMFDAGGATDRHVPPASGGPSFTRAPAPPSNSTSVRANDRGSQSSKYAQPNGRRSRVRPTISKSQRNVGDGLRTGEHPTAGVRAGQHHRAEGGRAEEVREPLQGGRIRVPSRYKMRVDGRARTLVT